MAIHVVFFASVRERVGRADCTLHAAGIGTAAAAWQAATAGQPVPERILVAVNQVLARLDTPVADGDEVAFFPPVTGG